MAVTRGHGNPKWTREEVILALDLYLSCKGVIPSRNDRRVNELSALLRKLPYHEVAARKSSFRNADGVAFKLQNIRQVATGKGLGNVSETDREVWADFGSQPEKVRGLAELIRREIQIGSRDIDGDEEEFAEGRLVTSLHRRRERSPKVRKYLLLTRRRDGLLRCDMCTCTSSAPNPAYTDAIFEAHHRKLHSMSDERRTRVSDMALLCANCHRLLHRAISVGKRWMDVEEGKRLLNVPGKR